METKLFSTGVQTAAHSDVKKDSSLPTDQQKLSSVMAKNQLNAAIVQSTVDVNVGSKFLSLTFKAAIEGINDALKETLGDNAIQNTYDSGLDMSPEATAERIVSLSTAFFGSYQQQHPELSQEEALTQFIDIISRGINTGFAEARNILSGLHVLEGDIADNINLTYDLVQHKLASFIENFGKKVQ